MIYVLCKTYRDFDEWRKRNGLQNGKEARYIQDDRAIRGRRGGEYSFIRLHGWRDRPDCNRILGLMRSAGMTELPNTWSPTPRPMMIIEFMNRTQPVQKSFTVSIS